MELKLNLNTWWVIHGEEIMDMLKKVEQGDRPEEVYLEHKAKRLEDQLND